MKKYILIGLGIIIHFSIISQDELNSASGIPEGTVKKIGPLDIAKFDIEIENMGNAKTTVICNAINLPEGWVASVDQETIIETGIGGNNPKKTVSLAIQPPYGFGYHDDREIQNHINTLLLN